jgi:uncharacterized protein YceK
MVEMHARTGWIRRALVGTTMAAAALLSGCASVYVDTATKDVPAAEIKAPAKPAPVRLVFEFQTKGAPNASATNLLKAQVAEQIKGSGLFAGLSEQAGPDVAMLNVTLNNVPITQDAAAQGFVTGLTFGLAGSAVTDGYICTVSYLPANSSTAVVKTARHAIHTVLGNAQAPAGAVKAEGGEAAARTMTKQIIANALRDLSRDSAFSN